MALLELGGRKFTIPAGEVLLGADPGCAIPLAVPGVLPRHAKLKGLPDGQVVITKAVPPTVCANARKSSPNCRAMVRFQLCRLVAPPMSAMMYGRGACSTSERQRSASSAKRAGDTWVSGAATSIRWG